MRRMHGIEQHAVIGIEQHRRAIARIELYGGRGGNQRHRGSTRVPAEPSMASATESPLASKGI